MKRTMLLAATAIAVTVAGAAVGQTMQPQINDQGSQPQATQNQMPENQAAQGQSAQQSTTGQQGDLHWTTASLEDLIGRDVYDANGNKLGEVADVILDSSTREATVAIVDHGGFLGLGTKQAPIDINMMHAQGDRIVIDGMTKEQIQAMQDFDYDDATVSLGRESKSGTPSTNTTGSPATPAAPQ